MANANPIKGEQDKEIGAFFAPLSVSPQQVPNMTVSIRAGSYWTAGGGIVEFPGGNSPLFTAPPSSARWTLVVLNSSGSIQLINGTVSPTPSIPVPPQGALPLAAVYLTSTTTQITTSAINDVRPFARIVDSVPNLQGELAVRPTFTDMNNAISAAISGGAVLSVNSQTGNVVLTAADVGAAQAGDNVSIFNNDAGYQNGAAVSAAISAALVPYAPLAAANTFTGNLTVQTAGNQPVSVVSTDTGSSGLLVDRGANPDARLEWDESLTSWLIGTTGSMNTVLTSTVVSSKMDKVIPAPVVGNMAVFGAGGQVVDGGPVVAAPVLSVNSFTGAVVLTAADVGAATAAEGALATTAVQPATLTAALAPKADKVVAPVVGNFAGLDGSGNLTDSGFTSTDFATSAQGGLAATALQPADVGVTVAGQTALTTHTGNANIHVDHTLVSVLPGIGLVGGGSIDTNVTLALGNSGVTAGPYGAAATVPTFSVDPYGRLTTAADVAIQVAQSQVTGLVADLGTKAPLASPVFTGVPVLPTYTVATVPVTVVPGGMIFVSDAAAGVGRVAYGNTAATAWIDPQTGAAVAV